MKLGAGTGWDLELGHWGLAAGTEGWILELGAGIWNWKLVLGAGFWYWGLGLVTGDGNWGWYWRLGFGTAEDWYWAGFWNYGL